VDGLARDVVELLATDARTRGIELRAGPLAPVVVRADPRALSRELFTAMLDAFEAAGPAGVVQVSILEGTRIGASSLRVRGEPGAAGALLDRTVPLARAS
jgi:hypothetical protein